MNERKRRNVTKGRTRRAEIKAWPSSLMAFCGRRLRFQTKLFLFYIYIYINNDFDTDTFLPAESANC